MSATLKVIDNFSLENDGVTLTGKQGPTTDDATDTHDITVTGLHHSMIGSLATATVATVYDDSVNLPADFGYLFFWASVDMYLQIVGTASSAIFKVLAKTPFTLSTQKVLGLAATTIMAGGAEPSVTDVKKVHIGNYSGGAGDYRFAVIY